MRVLLIFCLCFLVSCGGRSRRVYPWKPGKGQRFIGHKGNGIGILKDKDILYLGRFNNGWKNGIFKIIYPNGDSAYAYFKKSYASFDTTKVGSFTVFDGKPYATFLNGVFASYFKSLEIVDEDKKIKFLYLPKNKSGKESKRSITEFEVSKNRLNGSEKTVYTQAAQMIHAYKYIDGDIIGPYRDAFGANFYLRFKRKTDSKKNYETIYNKRFGIELSKVTTSDGVYQGETKKGVPHGFGSLNNGKEVIIGFFENGKANGSANVIDEKGFVHYGFYQNGKKNGAFIKAFQGIKASLIPGKANLSYVKTLDKIFEPLEKWYKAPKGNAPAIAIPTLAQFEAQRGKLRLLSNNRKKIDYKHKLPTYNFSGNTNFYSKWRHLTLTFFEHDYESIVRSVYKRDFDYVIYKDDQVQSTGRVVNKVSSKCPMKVRGFNITVYPNKCSNPDFYFSSISRIVHQPKLKDGMIDSGYLAHHVFNGNYGYHGPFSNGLKNGLGIDFYKKLRGKFVNNQLEGMGLNFSEKYYAYGPYKNGKKNGVFWKKGKSYGEYERGKFVDGKAQGRFKLENIYKELIGYSNYKDGKRSGIVEKRRLKDNSIYTRISYVEGKASGKATCVFKNKPEECEFKDGKRIDDAFKNRESKRKARIAAEKRRKEQRRREEQRRQRARERRARAKAREDRARRQRNAMMIMQTYQNSINSIKNTVPKTNYNPNSWNKKYSKKKTNSYNTNRKSNTSSTSTSTSRSSGLGLTLTRGKKPYKQCILEENYKGNVIKIAYDCNDPDGTLPKARQSMAENKAWYDREEQKRLEAKRINDERVAKMKDRMMKACNEFYAKNGHYCLSGCDPKIFDMSQCKVLVK